MKSLELMGPESNRIIQTPLSYRPCLKSIVLIHVKQRFISVSCSHQLEATSPKIPPKRQRHPASFLDPFVLLQSPQALVLWGPPRRELRGQDHWASLPP